MKAALLGLDPQEKLRLIRLKSPGVATVLESMLDAAVDALRETSAAIPKRARADAADDPPPDDLNLERRRVWCIGRALIRTRGQQQLAAELLGVTPRVLRYLIASRDLQRLVAIGHAAASDEAAAQSRLAQFVATYVIVVDSALRLPKDGAR